MARAVRFDHYGGGDVLFIADVEVPAPAAGEVVVEVRAAGINPGEAAIRVGALDAMFPATFPSGEGSDLAGVVSAIGDGVSQFAVGDEVLGWSWRRSSHAEYVAVPVSQLIPKPPALSWEVAGSLYVVACTAYAAVRAVGADQGDTVAVSAAAGGVGTVVVAVAADEGRECARDRVGGQPRLAGGSRRRPRSPTATGSLTVSRLPRPMASTPSSTSSDPSTCSWRSTSGSHPIASRRSSRVTRPQEVGAKVQGSGDASTTDVLSEMAELVASGRIEIPIAATYPLERVRDAYAELEARHTHGKIVLIP